MVGHWGENTIHVELSKRFYWPKMKEDVEHYVHTCMKCQGTKSVHKKKYGLYKPLPIPNDPFESISMDFVSCLPLWEEKDTILVVVDRFSKLAKFGTTKTIATMAKITTLFFNMWIRHHGMLEVIISDWNVKFVSKFWTLFMEKVETKLKFNTTFHLQTDGQTEKVNGILNQYLRNYVSVNHRNWGHKFGLVEFCYNSTKHSTTWILFSVWNPVKNPFEKGLWQHSHFQLVVFVLCGDCDLQHEVHQITVVTYIMIRTQT